MVVCVKKKKEKVFVGDKRGAASGGFAQKKGAKRKFLDDCLNRKFSVRRTARKKDSELIYKRKSLERCTKFR